MSAGRPRQPAPSSPADGFAPMLRLESVVVDGTGAWPRREFTAEFGATEAVAVLGPRGSGKTALLDVVCGFLRAARGRIALGGEAITGWVPHRIARAGVARTFQGASYLDGTAVSEALLAAAIGRGLDGRQARDAVRWALAITGLEAKMHATGAALGPAEQRLLTLARVAAAAPRLALLDEPLAGLAPEGTGAVVAALRRLRECGATLIVTAHEAASVRLVCSRTVLLRDGRIVNGGA